ncbi:hypothetical protein GCM10017668_68270 [Streptomyces tuirus]|uniref:Uncharacterized protein n=1 Tax=Streptomyces tuirus TaxID=68278 RepID=A0A7G1NTM4_9ACTN|nr:hypothetical protein GCM10017668_68270 [Streptomyces tuirus]
MNSPGLLRSLDLTGRTVVQKTTAGTVGALALKEDSLMVLRPTTEPVPGPGEESR